MGEESASAGTGPEGGADLEARDVIVVLRALADPVRLELVRQLRRSGAPIACGMFDTPVAKNTLSHHFKTLRDAGIVSTHRRGTQFLNVLREAELDAEFPGLLDAILSPRR